MQVANGRNIIGEHVAYMTHAWHRDSQTDRKISAAVHRLMYTGKIDNGQLMLVAASICLQSAEPTAVYYLPGNVVS